MRFIPLFLAVAAAALLGACGGGDTGPVQAESMAPRTAPAGAHQSETEDVKQ